MRDVSEQLGYAIRTLRRQAGLRQAELAQKANISRSHISRIEKGKYNMRIDNLADICRALRIEARYLLGFVTVLDPLEKSGPD